MAKFVHRSLAEGVDLKLVRRWPLVVAACMALGSAYGAFADDMAGRLTAQIAKTKAAFAALPAESEFVKQNGPGTNAQIVEAETQLKAGRRHLSLEALANAWPGTDGLVGATGGWGENGKGIEELEKQWNAAGPVIERDRKKFPARTPAGQSLFTRAIAELSLGQVKENYAAALEYGRHPVGGLPSGGFYLARAQGLMAFALAVSDIKEPERRKAPAIGSHEARIAALEKAIMAEYAKPGSTTFHALFITANSQVKLARELDRDKLYVGALVVLLRAQFAHGMILTPQPPGTDAIPELKARLAEIEKRLAADKRDHSIGELYAQKTQLALEAGAADGEAGATQRRRAAAFLNSLFPLYFAIMDGAK